MSNAIYKFTPQAEEIREILQSTLDVRVAEEGVALTMLDPDCLDLIDGQVILTTEQVATLIKSLAFVANLDAAEDDDAGYERGYTDGYADGTEVGYEKGYELGNERGFDAALEDCA